MIVQISAGGRGTGPHAQRTGPGRPGRLGENPGQARLTDSDPSRPRSLTESGPLAASDSAGGLRVRLAVRSP